jgi:hypothetical protein
MAVLKNFDWSSGLPAFEQFPGAVSTGNSWGGGGFSQSPVWTITYDNVPVPETDSSSSLLKQTSAAYAQLVRASRDEMKLVERGFLLGSVFIRPQTPINPLPLPVNSGIRFALLQTCDKRGGYATGGNERALAP